MTELWQQRRKYEIYENDDRFGIPMFELLQDSV
jgi:hypothetical protein